MFSDNLKHKNGKIIEGDIIKKTDEFIKIDFSGITLTYHFDEIESINGINTQRATASNEFSDTAIDKDSISSNDKWDEYSKFMEQFYYLDKQNFSNITCDISIPIIDNTLATIKF